MQWLQMTYGLLHERPLNVGDGQSYLCEDEIRRIGLGSGLAFVVQGFQVIDANQIVIEQSRDSMGVKHLPWYLQRRDLG